MLIGSLLKQAFHYMAMNNNEASLFYQHSRTLWSPILNIVLKKNVETNNHR